MERTILILIDALGFELAERHRFQPAHLDTRARLRTVLGFSQAALTSIFTGCPPVEHGLWMMYAFSSRRSPFSFLDLLPANVSLDRLWLRRLVNWKLRRVDGISAYYSLYRVPRGVIRHLDLPARNDLFAPRGGGRAPTIVDELYRRDIPVFVRDYRTPEAIAFDELEREVGGDGAPFCILYTAGLDSDLHRYGSADDRIGDHLAWYGKRIGAVQAIAPDARIIVMGDHGMCDVSSHIDLIPMVESLGLSVPDDYVPFYDSTMARFRTHSAHTQSILERRLSGISGGNLLDHGNRERLGIDIPGDRFGDVVFLADPGVIILPSFMSADPVRGMHGYHPDTPGMDSILLTNAVDAGDPRTICDVAAWLVPGFEPAGGRERR